MRQFIDVTQPFIAICVEHEGDIFTKTHQEYLLNPLQVPLLRATTTTGGIYSTDSEEVRSSESKSKEVDVPPLSAVPNTLSTLDEYYEFVVWWTVTYVDPSGATVQLEFHTYKGLADAEASDDIPILRKAGFIVPQAIYRE